MNGKNFVTIWQTFTNVTEKDIRDRRFPRRWMEQVLIKVGKFLPDYTTSYPVYNTCAHKTKDLITFMQTYSANACRKIQKERERERESEKKLKTTILRAKH